MIKDVKTSIGTVNDDRVDIVQINFVNGKSIKMIFDREGRLVKEG